MANIHEYPLYTHIDFLGNKKMAENAYYDQLKHAVTVNDRLLFPGVFLERAYYLFPDQIALIYHDVSYSYRTLYKAAVLLSRTLKERGMHAGDKILMVIENSPAFYIAYYAIWQIGAVVVPLNTFLGQKEREHIIADAQPAGIIVGEQFADTFVTDEIPIITVPDTPDSAMVDAVVVSDDDKAVSIGSDQLAALLYTSGTTGLPKGVMLSSDNIMINIIQGLSRIRTGPSNRVLGILPLFHVFAQNTCVWASTFVGITVILAAKIDRKNLLNGFLHKPTLFLGVPALYGLLCMLKTVDLSSVELFVSGADALPDKIRSLFALLYDRKISSGYGLTETSPLIAFDMDDYGQVSNTVGKPCMDIAISLRGEAGNDVDPGQIGELWIKGPNVMMGYYNAPKMTAEVMQDGWFNTGDLAYINRFGKIVIAGRSKDLIIHKGLNIYPQEIENIIMLHPLVMRVGVVGKIEESVGEVPYAFVQLRQEADDIENKLRMLCHEHLASYKVPVKFICMVDALETTSTGKVDKKILRKKIMP